MFSHLWHLISSCSIFMNMLLLLVEGCSICNICFQGIGMFHASPLSFRQNFCSFLCFPFVMLLLFMGLEWPLTPENSCTIPGFSGHFQKKSRLLITKFNVNQIMTGNINKHQSLLINTIFILMTCLSYCSF